VYKCCSSTCYRYPCHLLLVHSAAKSWEMCTICVTAFWLFVWNTFYGLAPGMS
jgi:hypothetical protein